MSDFVLLLSKKFRDVSKELKLDISNRNWDTVWYRLTVEGKYVDLGPDYLYDLIEVRQHNKKADIILSVGIDLVLGTRQTCMPYNFRVCAWWKAPKFVPIKKSKARNAKGKSSKAFVKHKLWNCEVCPNKTTKIIIIKKTNKKSQTRLFYIPFKVKIKGTKDNIIYNSIKT